MRNISFYILLVFSFSVLSNCKKRTTIDVALINPSLDEYVSNEVVV
jgi:hypothetical protein